MPKRKHPNSDSERSKRENELTENISRLVEEKNRLAGYRGNESDSLIHSINHDLPTSYIGQFLSGHIRARRSMKSSECTLLIAVYI